MATKTCTKCDEEKALSEFGKHRKGLRPDCKACVAEYQKRYRAANKEKLQHKKTASNDDKANGPEQVIAKTTKSCTKCHEEKPLSEFHKSGPPNCKACIKAYSKLYRAANQDKIRQQKKRYRTANLDKIKQYAAEYQLLNKERISQRRQVYRAANLGKLRAISRDYHRKHAEKLRLYYFKYYHNLSPEKKQKRIKSQNAQSKHRIKNDMNYRLRGNMRCRLYGAVKMGKAHKKANTLKLVGCTIDCLKSHLESQFTEGMSWDNYGAWNVDHDLPCAMFDLTQKCEQEKCFHYTNLQPLWSDDNRRKSAKVTEEDAILTAIYLLFEENKV